MTTFEKAMAGDQKAVDRYFFTKTGATRSDEEFAVIFNDKLSAREKLLKVSALRSSCQSTRKRKAASVHVPFELLVDASDAIYARALGIQLT